MSCVVLIVELRLIALTKRGLKFLIQNVFHQMLVGFWRISAEVEEVRLRPLNWVIDSDASLPMDKDLASVSENLHGSFVYQMGRGGKRTLTLHECIVHRKQGPQSKKRLSRETGTQCNSTLPSPCFLTGARIAVTCGNVKLAASAQGHAPFAHNDGPNRWKIGTEAHNGVGIAEDVVEFGVERLARYNWAIARLLGVVVEGGSMYCCLWSWMIQLVPRRYLVDRDRDIQGEHMI
ncbi:hypothetical protein DFH09DRAFT_1095995 [Mycena vulgaris]|nr:hypothetical protein DFH09DRAFT_1095995 [Mycena vulgaris]